MNAPSYPLGRPATLRRRLLVGGPLPMTLVALALTATLGILHARILSTETQTVARIQAVRLSAAAIGVVGDDALRDAFARALSRAPPTARLVLRRDDAPDLVVDSGRPLDERRALRIRLSTPQGELETISDATALRERRIAGAIMTVLLMAGVLAIFALTVRALDRTVARPMEALRGRIDALVHPRARNGPADNADTLRAIDATIDDLVDWRARHEAAMTDALRHRLQDIARHTRFVEQIGDHFRQPLQALSLFVAGKQPGDDIRQRAVLGQMRSSLTRLNDLLDGLLEMARFDAGAIEPSAVDFIAAELFVRERERIEVDARERGVDLRWRGGRLPVHGDPVLLGELLHRLVAHAVISTPNGRVLVAVRRRGDAMRIEVRDNGMGLDPIQQERVFEDFTRLPGHTGYGLALTVARRIVDTLGGTIGVRSSPGHGSLFWAHFPHMAVDPSPRTTNATAWRTSS